MKIISGAFRFYQTLGNLENWQHIATVSTILPKEHLYLRKVGKLLNKLKQSFLQKSTGNKTKQNNLTFV